MPSGCPSGDRRVGFDYKAKRFVRAAHLPPLEAHHAWKEIFSPATRAALLGARNPAWDPVDLYRERYAETAGAESLARLQDVDLGIYMVDDLLVKTDRSSMAHSLETRVPFLDQKVAEFAFSLPRALRVRGFAKKRLLRQALAPLLPKEVVGGRKQGFSVPVAAWLRGPLQPFAREVLSTANLERQACLDPATVRGVLDRHTSGREDLSRQLWGLIAFTLWFDRYALRGAPMTQTPETLDALYAFLLAGVLTLLLVPMTIRIARWVGAIDQPNERSLHVVPTPKLGGLAVLVGVLAASLIWLPDDSESHAIEIGAIVIALVGVADDLYDLSPIPKLLGQTVAVVIPVAAGVTVDDFTFPFFGRVEPGAVDLLTLPGGGVVDLGQVLTVLGIVAMINVINLIDGVDGLAAGVCVISALTLAVIALSLDRTAAAMLPPCPDRARWPARNSERSLET